MVDVVHLIGGLGTGGAEHLVVNLCTELRETGINASIATLTDTTGVPYHRAIANGIPVTALGRVRADPRLTPRVRRLFKTSPIVHVHLFPALYWAAFAAERIPTPWVYTEHSTGNRRRSLKALTSLERAAYSRPSKLVAISDGVRSSLSQHLQRLRIDRNIDVIPNGVAPEFYLDPPRRQTPSGKIRVIAVGTLDSRKNFGLALEVVARSPAATLTILGSGPDREQLTASARRLGITTRVTFVPTTDNVTAYLDRHDVLLSTSVREGFGLVAVEAMARGLPVVAPRIPGIGEVVEDNVVGLLYTPGKDAAFNASEHLRSLIDSRKYQALSVAATSHAHRFSIRQAARSHAQLYETVLSESVV